MLDLHVDVGQILIATLIAAFGWLLKTEIHTFKARLDKHDMMLVDLVADVQRLIGSTYRHTWSGYDRRKEFRENEEGGS